MLGWIIGFFTNLLKSFILKPLATVIGVLSMWGFNALIKSYPGRATWIIDQIMQKTFALPLPWARFVGDYVRSMTGTELPTAALTGKTLGGITDDLTRQFIDAFFNQILQLVLPSPEAAKANPLDGAERFLAANLKFQMDSWWLHAIADIFSLGAFKSLKDLPNAISWSLGIGWLSWLVMGTPFQAAICKPMERYFNRIYLHGRLTPAQRVEAVRKGLMSMEKFNEEMLDDGISPEVFTLMFSLGKKDLSRGDLRDMLDRRMLETSKVEEELKGQGFSDTYSATLTRLMYEDKIWSLKEDVAKKALYLFGNHDLSEGDLRGYLVAAMWREEEIDLAIIKGKLDQIDNKKLSDSDVAHLFLIKVKPWTACVDILVGRGYSREDAENYMRCRIPKEQWYG